MKTRLANIGIVVAATVVALLLGEVGTRLVLDPVDYLFPQLVRDDIVGITLPAGSGGHDAWGFRNRRVPETADVVALGDSHTYGNCAKMDEAWPGVLGRLTGESVYNLGLGGLLQPFKGRYQVENAARLDDATTSLLLPEKNIREAFVPAAVLRGLDQQSASVIEGMRLTFQLLHDMSALCARDDIRFLVAVIPTKETVYARFLEQNAEVKLHDVLDAVIANERIARRALLAALEEHHIAYVDLLPALEKASEAERIYTYRAVDMHPNQNGYRVIAEAIAQHLTDNWSTP